jgi:hypothetical protein
MPLFHKRNKISARAAKKFYKQLIEQGIPKKTAQKTVQLYKEE